MQEKTLYELVKYARLAPSSHNTQPWCVSLTKSGFIITGDHSRHLAIGDPEKREMAISIGCFTEAACKAAEGFGLKAEVTIHVEDRKVELSFSAGAKQEKEWLSLLEYRRSDRRLYVKRELDPTLLNLLTSTQTYRSSLLLVQDAKSIERLAVLTSQATRKLMLTSEFRAELASWVRNNWTKKHDGMPGYTQGIPGPISLLAKKVIKNNKAVAKDQAKKDAHRIIRSSAVMVISVKDDSFSSLVNAGRDYLSTCLIAEKFGAKTSAISAAVIDSEYSGEVTKLLGLDKMPVCILRIGYRSGRVKKSPRRNVEELLLN